MKKCKWASKKAYKASKGHVCPWCGFDIMETDWCGFDNDEFEIDQESHKVTQGVKCIRCGAVWEDEYVLTGYRFIMSGSEFVGPWEGKQNGKEE
jgi:DNA-directed RNA polymerase subunit RPC12/RpoP